MEKNCAKPAMTGTFETGTSAAEYIIHTSNCRVHNFICSERETEGKAPRQRQLAVQLDLQTLLALARMIKNDREVVL